MDLQQHDSIYIFGYGSLMHPSSVRETIADYDETIVPLIPAILSGFRRDFSAVSRNARGFTTPEGVKPACIAYMNVHPAPKSRALGVLLRVRADQLGLFDERESMYSRMDVTERIVFPSGVRFQLEESAWVYTYVCSDLTLLKEHRGSIAIGTDYEQIIQSAHHRIDEELGGSEFSADFRAVVAPYRPWPRVSRSNMRDPVGYQ